MTGSTHSQGAYTELLIEPGSPTYTWDASSLRFELLGFSVAMIRRMIGGQGIWGTLEEPTERVREGASPCYGEMLMYISPNDIDKLADDVWGMSNAAGTYSLDDTGLPYFGMLLDADQGVFEYQDAKCAWWELSGNSIQMNARGEPDMMILKMGFIASDVFGPNAGSPPSWPGSPPAKTYAANDAPYVFADLETSGASTVTLFGAVRSIQSVRLRQDNFLKAKFTNSLRPHSIRSRRRRHTAQCQLPWNADNDDLHYAAAAGAAASFVLTNALMSTQFNYAILRSHDRQEPLVRGKEEIGYWLSGTGYSSGDIATASNRALQIVNDSNAGA